MFKCRALKVSFAYRQSEYKGRIYFVHKESFAKAQREKYFFHLPSSQVYYHKAEFASRGE